MNVSAATNAATEPWQLAPVRLWHVAQVWQLERACFGTEDAYDPFTLFSLLSAGDYVHVQAREHNKMIGFVAGEIETRRRIGWIVTICVDPHHTSQGIGTQLLAEAERQLARRVNRIQLTVRKGNHGAIRLYERCNYKWTSTFTRYYRNGEDGLVMEKQL